MKRKVSFEEMLNLVDILCKDVCKKEYTGIYGIPKNGLIVASIMARKLNLPLVSRDALTSDKILIVDDIVDSGTTIATLCKDCSCDIAVLISKKEKAQLHERVEYVAEFASPDSWISWHFEAEEVDREETVRRMIQQVGENSSREGLVDTPKRVVKSFDKLFGGYQQDAGTILKTTFSSCYDEIILLKDISLCSTCEHHLLPFTGKCHIAYIPGICGKVVGISKLARLMEAYARRMQIQEQLTIQIGEALVSNLNPRGAAVIIQATHMCMTARGVEKPGAQMVTSYMYGCFKDEISARQELLDLIKL